MFLLPQFKSLCAAGRALIFFILSFQVIYILFIFGMGEYYIFSYMNKTSKEYIQQETLELRQLLKDLINNKIDNQSVLKRIQKYEIQHDNASSFHDEDTIIESNKNFSETVNHVTFCARKEPSLEYETKRHRIRFNILEMWSFFRFSLDHIRKNLQNKTTSELVNEIEEVKLLGAAHKRSLIADVDELQQLDGYDEWRQKELRRLNQLMQHRLKVMQNPKDCKTARKLLCTLIANCGLGCFMHHLVDCFIKAYAEGRTVILIHSDKWAYNASGWEKVYKPVSDTCLTPYPIDGDTNYLDNKNRVIELPLHAGYTPAKPAHFPKAIPKELANRLKNLSDEPCALWVGFFLRFIMQQQQSTQDLLKSRLEKLGWRRPIVGVHVRRTDKNKEAPYHVIEEYMMYVEDYYLSLELNGTKQDRRIYLATDEPSVLEEARKKYPNYEIICNPDAARLANLHSRYSQESLYNTLLDLHLLSMSDFVVCTLSSTFCRSIYEMKAAMDLDVVHRFKSVDKLYFYSGQTRSQRRAVIAHEPIRLGEVAMSIGDKLDVNEDMRNGYYFGWNLRTLKSGLFPSYKTEPLHKVF